MLENIKIANQKKAQDPVWIEATTDGAKKRSQKGTWVENHRIAMQKRSQNKGWINNVRISAKKRSEDPAWIEANRISNKNLLSDPNWIEAQKTGCQKRSQRGGYLYNLKNANRERSQSPIWYEKRLILSTGQGFWYGHPIINSDVPRYISQDDFTEEKKNRVRAAHDYRSGESGVDRWKNWHGNKLTCDHLYENGNTGNNRSVIEWDGDKQLYRIFISVGTKGKPEIYTHYTDNPERYTVLTHEEHGKKRGKNIIPFILKHEALIKQHEAEGRPSIFSPEQYAEYLKENADEVWYQTQEFKGKWDKELNAKLQQMIAELEAERMGVVEPATATA